MKTKSSKKAAESDSKTEESRVASLEQENERLRQVVRRLQQEIAEAKPRHVVIEVIYGQEDKQGRWHTDHEYTAERGRQILQERQRELLKEQEDIAARLAKLAPQPQLNEAETVPS